MRRQVKRVYNSLSVKAKFGVTLLIVCIMLTSFMLAAYASSSFTFSNWSPAKESVISHRNPKVSVYVKSTNNLNENSVQAKLNGNNVSASFEFLGHEESDSCGSWWVIDSYKEGTISFNTSNLADGTHTVEVRIADVNGNAAVESWSFTVASPPTFSNLKPDQGAKVGGITEVSAVVNSQRGVNWGTVVLKINGSTVPHTVDTGTRTVTYTGAVPDGDVTVYIEAKDIDGYLGHRTWSFNKLTALPTASNWTPARNGTVKVTNPNVSVYIKSGTSEHLNPSSVSAKLNSSPVTAEFRYKGYWYTDSCTGETVWYITDRREGTISFITSGLLDGVQNVQVSIADMRGNTLNESWNFTVSVPPTFSNFVPANNAKVGSVNTVSVKITDNEGVDWNSVVVKLNNKVVTHTVDQGTSTVTHTGAVPEGVVTVSVTAKDNAGNTGTGTWKFANDNSAPTLHYFSCPTNITNGMLTFSGQLKDAVHIKRNFNVSMTGTELGTGVPVNVSTLPNVSFYYKGYTDSCTGNYIETHFDEAYFSYSSQIIRDGDYTLSFYWEDELGHNRTHNVNLTVRTPPVLADQTPIQYGMRNLTPEIAITARDINGTIANIVLKLNGETVSHNYNPATNRVSYIPAEPLADESYHTVFFSATDDQGLTSTRTWKFLANEKNYPDMYDANYVSCTACHNVLANSAYHGSLNAGGNHWYYGCNECHSVITAPAGCGQCHYGDDECNDDGTGYHGLSPNFSAANYDPLFPLRLRSSREMFDCIVCHQPGASTRVYGATTAGRPMKHHDIPQLHLTKNTPDFCNACHAMSLTREHARTGRTDDGDKPITCNTCHLSTKKPVKDAIKAKNTSCEACHPNADHDRYHIGSMDSRCEICHTGVLTTEHMTSPTTTGKNYNCRTCHVSGRREVQRTVFSKRLNCTGCHTKGHDVYFADTVPDEIPLYEAFNWTTPIEAEIFAGELHAPSGYDGGQVVLSNRRKDVTASEIWQFYNTRLTAKDWTVKSGAPASGATYFAAEFVKQNRGIFIYCFKTSNRDGNGPEVPAGYRIEIWYK